MFDSPKDIEIEFINIDSFVSTTIYESKKGEIDIIQNFGEEANYDAEEAGVLFIIFDQKNYDRLIFEVEVLEGGSSYILYIIILLALGVVVVALSYCFFAKPGKSEGDYHGIELNDEPQVKGEYVKQEKSLQ